MRLRSVDLFSGERIVSESTARSRLEALGYAGLTPLAGAELLYQGWVPSQATYLFKHPLIQEAVYQFVAREFVPAVPSARCAGLAEALSGCHGDPA